jgi:hypothetical protein
MMNETTEQSRGPNICIMGPAGTGKTYSIGTLVDAGVEVFYVDLETGLEALLGYWKDRGLAVPANLHYCRLPAPTFGFSDFINNAKRVLQSPDGESLCKLKDPDKMKHDRYVQLLTIFNNFPDERTGQSYGSVQQWSSERALVIDGLTGMGECVMSVVIGGKPAITQTEWGIAQGELLKLLKQLANNCACWFVLLAHVEREVDQINGGLKLMVSTLGKALPPKIPSVFSDIILSSREGEKWTWDTASGQADLKTRNLPIKAGQSPNFLPILTKWRNRVTTETDLPAPKIDTIIP